MPLRQIRLASYDQVQKQYCAFLSDYLQYGEEYIVSVRAGSVDNWSLCQFTFFRFRKAYACYCFNAHISIQGASGVPRRNRCA